MSKKPKQKPSAKTRVQDTRMPFERHSFWIAVVVLAVLLSVFFYPVIFQGKTALAPDKLASYSNRTLIENAFQEPGSFLEVYPLWSPYIFSGMPSFGSLITAPYTNPIAQVFRFAPWRVRLIIFYFLIGLFSWVFLRRQGLGHTPALFGAVSFLFCTQLITLFMFSHNSKIVTLVYMPLILTGVVTLWKRMDLLWASLLALAVAWMLLAHHVQVSYYVLMAVGIFLIVSTGAAHRDGSGAAVVVWRWVRVTLSMGVGLMTSMLLYLPVQEYAKYSIRGGSEGGLTYEYATSWSLHPLEMATFLIPSFMGYGGSTYWGWMPFTDFPLYMGILPLFLAVLTVVFWPKERFHVFLWVTAAFALVVAFGRHLPLVYNAMFNLLPFFNKFRVPVMITFLLQFSVAALAAIALDRLMRHTWDTAAKKKFLWTGGVFLAVFFILGALGSGSLESTIQERLMARPALIQGIPAAQLATATQSLARDAVSLARNDFMRVLLILGVGLALVWGRVHGRINNRVLGIGLLALTVVDLWVVDLKPANYGTMHDLQAKFQPTATVQYLKTQEKTTGPFRILPIEVRDGNPNFYAYFEISSISGYHAAKLKLYQDMIDDQGPVGIYRQIQRGNYSLIDMLGTRFIICSERTGQAFVRMDGERFKLRQGGQESVVENTAAMDRMWFVDRFSVTPEENLHLGRLSDLAWDPRVEAILFEEMDPIDGGQGATAHIEEYRPRQIKASLQSPGNCLMVMSEVYFPKGWTYTLDGEPIHCYRANYGLRAFRVPPGNHTFLARFDPPSFYRGIWMGGIGSGLIAVGLIAGGISTRKRLQLR